MAFHLRISFSGPILVTGYRAPARGRFEPAPLPSDSSLWFEGRFLCEVFYKATCSTMEEHTAVFTPRRAHPAENSLGPAPVGVAMSIERVQLLAELIQTALAFLALVLSHPSKGNPRRKPGSKGKGKRGPKPRK